MSHHFSLSVEALIKVSRIITQYIYATIQCIVKRIRLSRYRLNSKLDQLILGVNKDSLFIEPHGELKYLGVTADLWKQFDRLDKVTYLKGVFDGAIANRGKLPVSKLSVEEYVFAIDQFYLNPKNRSIPVPMVVNAVSMVFQQKNHLLTYGYVISCRSTFHNWDQQCRSQTDLSTLKKENADTNSIRY